MHGLNIMMWADPHQCVKSVRIRSFSGPYFPTFGLNTDVYSVNSKGYKWGWRGIKKTWIKKLPLSIFDEVVSWTETFRETVWRILSCLLAFYLLNLLGRNFRVLLISTNIFSLLSFDHGLVLSKYYWFLKTSSFFPYRHYFFRQCP